MGFDGRGKTATDLHTISAIKCGKYSLQNQTRKFDQNTATVRAPVLLSLFAPLSAQAERRQCSNLSHCLAHTGRQGL
jgi:hypothetical protein